MIVYSRHLKSLASIATCTALSDGSVCHKVVHARGHRGRLLWSCTDGASAQQCALDSSLSTPDRLAAVRSPRAVGARADGGGSASWQQPAPRAAAPVAEGVSACSLPQTQPVLEARRHDRNRPQNLRQRRGSAIAAASTAAAARQADATGETSADQASATDLFQFPIGIYSLRQGDTRLGWTPGIGRYAYCAVLCARRGHFCSARQCRHAYGPPSKLRPCRVK